MLSTLLLYCSSDNSPLNFCLVTSDIHPLSIKTNFPASGIFIKCLYKNGFLFSSSVGSSMTATLKNLGSIFFITFPKTLPFPAAPQPSNKTTTGSFFSFIMICCLTSLSLAALSLFSISSSDGNSILFQSFNILIISFP